MFQPDPAAPHWRSCNLMSSLNIISPTCVCMWGGEGDSGRVRANKTKVCIGKGAWTMQLTGSVHAGDYTHTTVINSITWYSLLPAPQYKHSRLATAVITGSISAQNESLFCHQSKPYQVTKASYSKILPVYSPPLGGRLHGQFVPSQWEIDKLCCLGNGYI